MGKNAYGLNLKRIDYPVEMSGKFDQCPDWINIH